MTGPADSGGTRKKRRIIVGKIGGVYGVKGWLRIVSYTRPKENILTYNPWLVGAESSWDEMVILSSKANARGPIAKLEGVDDRDKAISHIGKNIVLLREQMLDLGPGQYYWCDLIRLNVVNLEGTCLGKISSIHETGANDVIITKGKRRYLIPFIVDRYIKEVDLQKRRVVVDWDPEYS